LSRSSHKENYCTINFSFGTVGGLIVDSIKMGRTLNEITRRQEQKDKVSSADSEAVILSLIDEMKAHTACITERDYQTQQLSNRPEAPS